MTPKWNDPAFKGKTMKRTALWLLSEVGVGNSFTKEQHRAAFPGIAQADRRMRDLRKHGWVIHTSSQDLSLNSDEQRLVSVGAAVWESGRKNKDDVAITAKQRRAVFAESDYQCSLCGIAGGEPYPDSPNKTAVLGVARRALTLQNGGSTKALVAECELCRTGAKEDALNIPVFLTRFEGLTDSEKKLLLQWAGRGRRSRLDQVWRDYRRFPRDLKEELLKHMGSDE